MPSSLKRFTRPKLMKIRYGKGFLKAKVIGTYTRYVKGKKVTSHKIGMLGGVAKVKTLPKDLMMTGHGNNYDVYVTPRGHTYLFSGKGKRQFRSPKYWEKVR